MKKTNYFIVVAGLLAAGCGNRLLREAETHYANYEYAVAARQYETYLQKDSTSATAMLHLADCYRHMNHHADAQKWYAKAVTQPEATPTDKLRYAEELKSTGRYSEAQSWFDAYLTSNPNDKSAKLQRESCDTSLKASPYYDVSLVNLPSHSASFSPYFYKGKLYYSSEAPVHTGDHANNWTGNGYLDIYTADPSDPAAATPLDSAINSPLHESNVVFNPEGTMAYFTRSALTEKVTKRKTTYSTSSGAGHTNYLEICSAELKDGKWTNVKTLPFNSKDFSTGHPALTANGTRMYFTSDRPGGMGGTDIYYSDLVESNWTAPVNAGEAVNTPGNEMFPTIHVINLSNEELLFSSDGRGGAGGLDIFRTRLSNGSPTRTEWMTLPFNSPGDDFGLVFVEDGKSGYFSSNRDDNDGDDHIYSFRRKDPMFFVDVVVVDKESREPVPNTFMEVTNGRTMTSWNTHSDASGHVFFPADSLTNYGFTLRCDQYFCGFNSATTTGFRGNLYDTTHVTIQLEKIVINKPIRLDNIYYDYNKWNIRPDAAVELDKLVKIMQDNPKIRIELSSHTDCRGSDKYNMTLSQKRAQSAVDYIVSKGISKDRIYAKGYGESKPLNKCVNGVKCTEEEYQWNRRTEFKVVEILQ